MKLVQLVYFSKSNSKPATKNDDIKAIHKTASEANGRLGISGLLLFSNEYFLQALEGPRQQVNDLYFRILNDPRHTHAQILCYRDIYKRDFSEWAMGWANESLAHSDIYFQYCTTKKFDPTELTGDSAHALLCEFAKLIRK
jgi:hypothetical protein